MDTLAFGYILPATGRIRDFHPLETCAARRTIKNRPAVVILTTAGRLSNRPVRESNPQLALRSMAYHVIHGSDVTSNIIPYAE